MAKLDVNGENANEVFKWLYSEKPFAGFGDSDTGKFMDGMLSRNDPDYASNPDIKWNFTKFLIDRKGRVVVDGGYLLLAAQSCSTLMVAPFSSFPVFQLMSGYWAWNCLSRQARSLATASVVPVAEKYALSRT